MKSEIPHNQSGGIKNPQLITIGFRRDYTCDTWEGEEIVQTTNLNCIRASKDVAGKLSRGLEVQVLSGAP